MNAIYRDEGVTQCYNRDMHIPDSNVHRRLNHAWKIQCQNFALAFRLNRTESVVKTHMEKKFLKQNYKKPEYTVSKSVMEKYSELIMPSDITLLNSLLRPKVFMDLEIRGLRPLGRIQIQLFTEACPDVVLAFTNFCQRNNFRCVSFTRVFPQVWMEGSFKLTENEVELLTPNFESNLHAVKHGLGPGILSFPKSFLAKGFPSGFVNFCISFKPLSVLNGEHLAFGIVNGGMRILNCIKELGTINGNLKRDIGVTKCGLLSKFSKTNCIL